MKKYYKLKLESKCGGFFWEIRLFKKTVILIEYCLFNFNFAFWRNFTPGKTQFRRSKLVGQRVHTWGPRHRPHYTGTGLRRWTEILRRANQPRPSNHPLCPSFCRLSLRRLREQALSLVSPSPLASICPKSSLCAQLIRHLFSSQLNAHGFW